MSSESLSPAVVPSLAARLWRPWALYLRINRLNLKAQAAYRGEFIPGLVFGVVWQGSIILFAGVLLSRFPGLGGWKQGDVLLVASMRLISHSVYVVVFANIVTLSICVQEGRMDGFLLRPMPVYRQVLLTQFRVNAFGDMLAGAGIFAVALLRLDIGWTPAKAFYVVVGVLGGALVEAALQTLLSIASFRFTGLMTWTSWMDQTISTFGNYPLNVLPGAVRGGLTFVLPVAFVAFLPAAVVTGHAATTGVPVWLTAASPLVGLLLFLGAKAIWYRSLRFYQSVGG